MKIAVCTFMRGNEKCSISYAPYRFESSIQVSVGVIDPQRTRKYITTLWWSRVDFYGRHTILNARCWDYKNSGKNRSLWSNQTKIKIADSDLSSLIMRGKKRYSILNTKCIKRVNEWPEKITPLSWSCPEHITYSTVPGWSRARQFTVPKCNNQRCEL